MFNEEPFWPLTQAYTYTSDQVSKQKQIFGTTPPEGIPAPFPTAMGNFASCPSQIEKMPFSEELCVRVQLYVRVCVGMWLNQHVYVHVNMQVRVAFGISPLRHSTHDLNASGSQACQEYRLRPSKSHELSRTRYIQLHPKGPLVDLQSLHITLSETARPPLAIDRTAPFGTLCSRAGSYHTQCVVQPTETAPSRSSAGLHLKI